MARRSKRVAIRRKKAARTVEAICDAIGQLLGSFTPQECANYIEKRRTCVKLKTERTKVCGDSFGVDDGSGEVDHG